jgi:hypothetical protein
VTDKGLLTPTRLSTQRRCPRQAWYRYELGLIRDRDETPRRFGTAFHDGREARNKGQELAQAIGQAVAGYATVPQWADPALWAVERLTVEAMLSAYDWRYPSADFAVVESEMTCRVPLLHPETHRAHRHFDMAGKLDGLVRLADGRLAVLEYKTTGQDITAESIYWLRLRCDPQISHYYLLARRLGHAVQTVLYDVTKRPQLKPRQIPLLDGDGLKIVLNRDGRRVLNKNGTPRQASSTADGYELQTRQETAEEFAERLLADIGERPDFYFARREVPILEDELAAFSAELWQQAEQIVEMRRRAAKLPHPASAWFRSVSTQICDGCDYQSLCLQSVNVGPGDTPPTGFTWTDNAHPELELTGSD